MYKSENERREKEREKQKKVKQFALWQWHLNGCIALQLDI